MLGNNRWKYLSLPKSIANGYDYQLCPYKHVVNRRNEKTRTRTCMVRGSIPLPVVMFLVIAELGN